jgi:MFS family permease
MDRTDRKQTMTLGFTCLGIMGFIIGGALEPLKRGFPLFVVLYGVFDAYGEMGPGVATFPRASESFPTPLRGHFIGLAAAIGKVGAVVGELLRFKAEDLD